MTVSRGVARPDAGLKLWIVLARAFDAVDRHSRESIARFGLGSTEFGVLEALYHKGELPVCEVQRRILVESSSTTYVVDKLCARGLVERRPSGADRCGAPSARSHRGSRLRPHSCCARWAREPRSGSRETGLPVLMRTSWVLKHP